jgi:hypothetical protein
MIPQKQAQGKWLCKTWGHHLILTNITNILMKKLKPRLNLTNNLGEPFATKLI